MQGCWLFQSALDSAGSVVQCFNIALDNVRAVVQCLNIALDNVGAVVQCFDMALDFVAAAVVVASVVVDCNIQMSCVAYCCWCCLTAGDAQWQWYGWICSCD